MYDNNIEIIKRQIEILGLCLGKTNTNITILDLSLIFNVSEVTIKRDLFYLRTLGIDIHSEGRNGICIYKNDNSSVIRNLLLNYLAICYFEQFEEFMDDSFKNENFSVLLENFVKLNMAMQDKMKIKLKTNININFSDLHYEPRYVFRKNSEWNVLLSSCNNYELIPLKNIKNVELLENDFFKDISKEELNIKLENITNDVLPKSQIKIKLAFAQPINGTFPKDIMKVSFYKENKDGTGELIGNVNSLDKIAGWILTHNKNIFIIEPEELKDKIIEIAKSILDKYKINKYQILHENVATYEDSDDLNDLVQFQLPNSNEKEKNHISYYIPKTNDFKEYDFNINICAN